MARATWLADVLVDAGLKVKPHRGWETRGKNDFAPTGIIWHHTVTGLDEAATDDGILTKGRSDLKGPLCNYSTNRDGSISIIAAGTANHGGKGSWRGVTGNRHWFGDEMKNLGTAKAEPWPDAQIEAAQVAAAAILRHLHLGSVWLCGHKEYAPGRKPDPHSLDMDDQRDAVKNLIRVLDLEEAMKFKDVPKGRFYSNAVKWAVEEGIASGINPPQNDLYAPDQPVTRGQMAVFLKRLNDRLTAKHLG